MMRGTVGLWAMVVLIAAKLPAAERQSESAGLLIPVPDTRTIDAAAWKRLTEGYQDQKQAFLELLLEVDANQIDYATDCLSDMHKKRQAIAQVLGRHQMQVTNSLQNPELESDYVRLGWEAWPRLTGNVVKVGSGSEFTTLEEALPKLQAGDTVQLGSKTFVLELRPDQKQVTDLAFIGMGPEHTVLKFQHVNGFNPNIPSRRWRFAELTIDCQGAETTGSSPNWIPGGSIELRNCTIANYSSHGAIARMAGVLMIEDCLFDGGTEPAGGRPFGPIWSQGEPTYIRNTRFLDNRDMMIPANAALVLDHCRFEKRNMQGDPNVFLGPQAFLRNNRGINLVGQQPKLLAFESDDAEFIAAVQGEDRKLDERARRIIETLKLDRHATYWIGLLRHRDEKIRRQAAGRVQALLGQEVAIPVEPKPAAPAPGAGSSEELAQAIRELDSDDFRTREQAAGKLRKIGEDAVAALREIEQSGSIEQKTSAHALLSEIARPQPAPPAPLAWEIQYGRIARWYEDHRAKLKWDEGRQRYLSR
ncbi:MAG: hypothetical protein MUE50_12385 [Pirellulaceae bacterium]|nr:hypothetical protein [Pirellulaceae bacterium]